MKNLYTHGDEFPYTNPSSSVGIASGDVVAMSDVVGIAIGDILPLSTGTVQVCGAFKNLAKKTSQVWNQGEKLYWDGTALVFTTAINDGGSPTPVAFVWAGWAYFSALSADAVGTVKLKIS